MKRLIFGLLVAQGLLFSSDLYKPCIGCHGANGETVANGVSKVIKNMSKEEFIAALKGYKDGSYGGKLKGLMKGQVTRLSEQDMESLADKITN